MVLRRVLITDEESSATPFFIFEETMSQKTPLYQTHIDLNAKIVDFGGWDMPLHYGSQKDEHHFVRQHAGMFDVTHMTMIDIHGFEARDFLSYLLANDVAKLTETGKALYTCMLNEDGGVIDDLICYFFDEDFFRLIVNASTRDKDLAWINSQAENFDVQVLERPEATMIAVQGPKAREIAIKELSKIIGLNVDKAMNMKPFNAMDGERFFLARTGYTGEDGVEVTLLADEAIKYWNLLLEAGVKPCGLGARDTLRLEAGMNLYGNDMDESTSPLVSALAWTVAMDDDRDFCGRDALELEKSKGLKHKLVGLLLEGKGIMRSHLRVVTEHGDGEITSGGYSPSLERSIAYARIPKAAKGRVQVDIRGRLVDARITKLSFVRKGKAQLEI